MSAKPALSDPTQEEISYPFFGGMIKLHFLYLICILSVLACCAPHYKYKIGSIAFNSSAEALKKQSEMLFEAISDIPTTDDPVHGSVLVLLPSDEEIQRNYLTFDLNTTALGVEPIHYSVQAIKNNFDSLARAIQKRNIFDSVLVAYHDGSPLSFPIGEINYLIYCDVDGWFIRDENGQKGLLISADKEKAPIRSTINGVVSFVPFLDSIIPFLDSTKQLAKVLQQKRSRIKDDSKKENMSMQEKESTIEASVPFSYVHQVAAKPILPLHNYFLCIMCNGQSNNTKIFEYRGLNWNIQNSDCCFGQSSASIIF